MRKILGILFYLLRLLCVKKKMWVQVCPTVGAIAKVFKKIEEQRVRAVKLL